MSGPPISITPWAPNANYATGTGFAWAGTPTQVTPAYVEFQPSPAFAPSAQEFNEIIAQRDAAINALGAAQQAAEFVTWKPSYVMSMLGTIEPTCAAWDPVTLKWLVGGTNATPNIVIGTGRGDPLNWSEVGGGPSTAVGEVLSVCRGIEPAVSNRYVYAGIIVVSGGSIPAILRADTVGLAFNTTLPEGGITDATGVSVGFLSGVFFACVGASSAGHSQIVYSTDHAVTWTVAVTASVAVSGWLLAQTAPGGGTFMAVPAAAGGSGPTYWTSTNGSTWTSQAGLVGLLTSTEQPSGLAYGNDSAGTPCWILTTFDSSTTQAKTYRSYNGTSWANFATTIPAGVALVHLSASGQQLIATVFEGPVARIGCSLDGGATWATTDLSLLVTSGSAAAAAGPNAFLALSNVMIAVSDSSGSPGGFGAP
jgi:hypothetical protein